MELKVKKISDFENNLSINGQGGCKTDCLEYNVWVGKTNGNDGCVIYSSAYTPKDRAWW
ncbi:hypothetical protein KDC22_07040 [Paenibacillus tritici]|uniref:hypothetical protein n=1 Tax=Paenibacillus tritici TaxID=1873425 RepID=UPI001BA5F48C|nr:hypothetical protein [Paenibacillus tritici]QUL56259.1 hypothetical protein KDC22_07040 [Paenibacillus tritici]